MKSVRGTRILLRSPTAADGAAMWELARASGVLESNSSYAYLMFAKFFAETCVLAAADGKPIGFVTGFIPPDAPNTVFVWQIGVSASYRGQGIAKKMLRELLERQACSSVRFLEATVSMDNRASRALFTGMAKELGTNCRTAECFPAHLFPEGAHEAEWTYRIGPVHIQS